MITVDWEREPVYKNPLVKVRIFGYVIAEREWNELGHLWISKESLWKKLIRKLRLAK